MQGANQSHLLSISNVTDKSFVARLLLKGCYGQVNMVLFGVSTEHHYIYHLYKDKISPFKFSMKGVPFCLLEDIDSVNKITDIFINRIPVNNDISENGQLKFVRLSHSRTLSRYFQDSFKEIEVAYPWGFQVISKNRKKSPKQSKKK